MSNTTRVGKDSVFGMALEQVLADTAPEALRILQRRAPSWIPKGTTVYNRDGSLAGVTTGGIRGCSCGSGVRVGVRWADKHTTFPCTKGLVDGPEVGTYRVG